MITEQEEATLIELLARAGTPTEVVRKAFKATQCDIVLTFGKQVVHVCDIRCRKHASMGKIRYMDRPPSNA